MISVSVVSHGHGDMVKNLLDDLRECSEVSRIIVTHNIPEPKIIHADARITVIDNPHPKGFGMNHNAAFAHCNTDYFCVLNPDIRLPQNPFSSLLQALQVQHSAMAAPLILAPSGVVEDSIRLFPTPGRLLAKALCLSDGRYPLAPGDPVLFPEWVAGMFMLFRTTDFAALDGFDEDFFLYYEDVDMCARLWRSGRKIVACPAVSAVHHAQRASHRNFRHMRWHLQSMARYFVKHLGRLPAVQISGV
jgi:hypothetical protein